MSEDAVSGDAVSEDAVKGQKDVRINGARYHVKVEGRGEPLLLLHGFTGSWKSWAQLIPRFAERYQVVAPDLLGHGSSEAPPDVNRYKMAQSVDDLVALMHYLGHPTFACTGYSMGGRIALSMACRHPDAIRALVLESTSPGLAAESERTARALSDEKLASHIETVGVPQFVEEWERIPLFQSQRNLPDDVLARQREIRVSQRADGLAGSLRGVGTGVQPSLWNELGVLTMPVLLLTGEFDSKFQDIAVHMQDRMKRASRVVIAGAGHTVHLEQPAAYADVVLKFLDETTRSWCESGH